jgi:hypothetical protein
MGDEDDSLRRMVGDYHVSQTIMWARASRRRLLEVRSRAEGSPDEVVDRYGELLLGLVSLESAVTAARHAVADHAPNLPKPSLPTQRHRHAISALRHIAAHEEEAIHEQGYFLIQIRGDAVVGSRGGRKYTLTFDEWLGIVEELETWSRTTAQTV